MSSIVPKSRPKHLNLLQIRLPMPGIVSILHRISGAILFLLLPLLLCLFQWSLDSPASFTEFRSYVSQPIVKFVLIGLLWGYLHHLFAGVRHVLLDLHIGAELVGSRVSSYLVFVLAIVLTLIVGGRLW